MVENIIKIKNGITKNVDMSVSTIIYVVANMVNIKEILWMIQWLHVIKL